MALPGLARIAAMFDNVLTRDLGAPRFSFNMVDPDERTLPMLGQDHIILHGHAVGAVIRNFRHPDQDAMFASIPDLMDEIAQTRHQYNDLDAPAKTNAIARDRLRQFHHIRDEVVYSIAAKFEADDRDLRAVDSVTDSHGNYPAVYGTEFEKKVAPFLPALIKSIDEDRIAAGDTAYDRMKAELARFATVISRYQPQALHAGAIPNPANKN